MTCQEVLDFWFANEANWYKKSDEFDNILIDKFMPIYLKAFNGELDGWHKDSRSMLALIILLDQFSRNMFRGTAKMYQADEKALSLAKKVIELKFDLDLTDQEKQFVYMPFMHSESLEEQNLCIDLFAKTSMSYSLDYAKQHQEIIVKFNRFPHRNEILGRVSTEEEVEYLKSNGGF